MLIWLASYPRSGNTFVRVVLNDVFGVKTYALDSSGDDRVFSSRRGVVDAVGHMTGAAQGAELIKEARSSERIYIVKTHEPPPTDDPAIYIVRDGRSAIVSYYHYLNDVERLSTPLAAVIDGQVYGGSWSDHIAAWQPLDRPNTLLLRYETMSNDHNRLIDQLSGFCSVRPRSALPLPFADLHRLYPEFFRKGDDASNIREIGLHLPRFMQLHAAQLRRLGYDTVG